MIDPKTNPVEWAGFLEELEDAQEHLNALLQDLQSDPDYDEVNLRIDLGHIYSHLNRAWHRRSLSGDLTEEEWSNASRFPNDLDPS